DQALVASCIAQVQVREFLSRPAHLISTSHFRSVCYEIIFELCVSGCLEAAHIRPYADEGPHRTNNGLLLRSDFHKLFDSGLVTVEPDYTIRISGRIRERYFNGKAYYRLHAQPLVGVPDDPLDRPSPEFLRWHNNERFLE
ncbi:MAG: HNH endonuclease, partial [Gammaproteobacteria bacterium]|nr:HNH endonuclease [Gammaproteobacteria bacterium]